MPRLEGALLALTALAPAIASAEVPTAPDVLARAEAARHAGDPARAILLLEPLLAKRPNDPDLLRRLGTSYAAAGRDAEAVATLEKARALAPDDLDIMLALARARLWSGDRAGTRREADAIRAVDPGNAELPELLDSLAGVGRGAGRARAPGLTASVGGSAVRLEAGGQQRWLEAVLAADVPIGARTVLSGEVAHSDRERAADTRLGLRVDYRASDAASFWLGATATPDIDYRERWSVRGGAELRMSGALSLFVDARHANYGDVSVTGLEPGVRATWDDGRWAAQLRSINLFDSDGRHRLGWSARVDRALPNDGVVFAGAATYPDTEAGVTRRVRDAFVGLAAPVSPTLTLRITADGERRARSYDRLGLSLGLTWRPAR